MKKLITYTAIIIALFVAGALSRSNGVEGNLPNEWIQRSERLLIAIIVLGIILSTYTLTRKNNSDH